MVNDNAKNKVRTLNAAFPAELLQLKSQTTTLIVTLAESTVLPLSLASTMSEYTFVVDMSRVFAMVILPLMSPMSKSEFVLPPVIKGIIILSINKHSLIGRETN